MKTTTDVLAGRSRAVWVVLLGVLLIAAGTAAGGIGAPARAQTTIPASNPLGPIPQRCPAGGPGDCLGGGALRTGFLTESWLGGLIVGPHLVHVGQQVTGTIGSPAALTTPCYGAPHCLTGVGWSGLLGFTGLGPQVSPCGSDYTATSCTVTAQTASAAPVAGESNWQIINVGVSGVPGSATDNDYIYVTSMAAISGYVLDSTGKPLTGATVLLSGPGGAISAPVDANTGFYYAMNLTAGSYAVTATDAHGVALAVTSCSGNTSGNACNDYVDQQDGTANFVGASPKVLVFLTQPQTWAMTRPLQQVQVAIEDLAGRTDTTATDSISVSLGANPSSAALGGTITKAAVNGVATFSDLTVDKPGKSYTLVARDTNTPNTTSTAFDIVDTWGELQRVHLITNALNGGRTRYIEKECYTWQAELLYDLGTWRASTPNDFQNLSYGPITDGGHNGVVLYIKGTDWHQTGAVVHGTAFFSQYDIIGFPNLKDVGLPTGYGDEFVFTPIAYWQAFPWRPQNVYPPANSRGNYFETANYPPGSLPGTNGQSCPVPPHVQTLSTHSPVDVSLVNSVGQHVQTSNGVVVTNELPLTSPDYVFHNDASNTFEWDLVLPTDSYQVTLTGNGTGPFTLTSTTDSGSGTPQQTSQTGTIAPGTQRFYTLSNTGQLASAGTGLPAVTHISPATGTQAGGTTVTIAGSGFSTVAGATSVKFGQVAATAVTCVDAWTCTATSPAGSGTVDVTLTTAGGISATSTADQFVYTAPCQNGAKADITLPVGSSIASGTPTFQWGGGACVTQYYLYAGSSSGIADLFSSGPLAGTVTSTTISPAIPLDGRTIYVRLWSLVNGNWQAVEHSYLMSACQNGAKADITSPSGGSIATGTPTFTWGGGLCVTQYYLYIGSSYGATDLFRAGPLASSVNGATVAPAIPVDGRTIYVRLWSLVNGSFQAVDHSYIMGACQNGAKADISSPVGGTLHGSSQTFQWSGGACVTQYYLYTGSSFGQANLYSSGPLAGTVISQTVATLPATGSTVYLRLWSLVNGGWLASDHSYVSAP